MGAWGANLFHDDTALDVRDTWRELFAGCATPDVASSEVLEAFEDQLDDTDDGPVILLTLAVLQHDYGCPDPKLRSRALEVIDNGEGLAVWEEQGPAVLKRRQRVYAQLRKKLESPPPPLKTVRRKRLERTSLEPGQLVSVQMESGRYRLLWVRALAKYLGALVPDCVFLDWQGETIPDRDTILGLSPCIRRDVQLNVDFFKKMASARGESEPFDDEVYEPELQAGYTRIFMIESHKRDYPSARVAVLEGAYSFDLTDHKCSPTVFRWSELDEARLDRLF